MELKFLEIDNKTTEQNMKLERAKEIIIENQYNICLNDHQHLKYLLEMIYIKGASMLPMTDEELIARAKKIEETQININ